MNKNLYILCAICERSFALLQLNKRSRRTLLRNPNNYICDTCRMHANDPRAMKRQHIQLVKDWEPDETKAGKCPYCGTAMWLHQFKLLVDREVTLEDNDIVIKSADEVITHYECPNPDCEKGRGKQPQHRYAPTFLSPPWAMVVVELFPGLAELPKDRQAEEFHRRWWHLYQKERTRNAGKGVTLKGMTQ